MKRVFAIVCFILFSLFCAVIARQNGFIGSLQQEFSAIVFEPTGTKICHRFLAPTNFKRITAVPNSFDYFLSNLPLKKHGSKVLFFNGTMKPNQEFCSAVIDLDIGMQNLQQCADAVIRLRAEYLFQEKKYAQIHFNFTNGFRANYLDWAKGNRIKVKGNDCIWERGMAAEDYSYKNFRKYLNMVYTYAGTLSLSKELQKKSLQDLEIGDVFIQGGSPGHAVIVVDLAVNQKTGDKVFLLAQSYMPAQSIHVLVNPNNPKISPWYALKEIKEELLTPEWTFTNNDLKQFKGE